MNICGCLIHAASGRGESVREELSSMEGVEVHALTADERLVVVVEDTGSRRASETIMAIHQIPGVMSLTLAYHHFDDPDAGVDEPRPVAASCAT